MIKKIIVSVGVVFVLMIGGIALFLFGGTVQPAQSIIWGVNFSAAHASGFGLDWKEVYLALLDEADVGYIKISLDWNILEPEQNIFFFEDADWYIQEAEKRNVQVVFVMGMKTMRWPECHIPEWAKGLTKKQQQQEILQLVGAITERYKDSPALRMWQVENEPLFSFGDCPWADKKFLAEEVALVRSIDPGRSIIVSDSGELSFWFESARIGDVVSPTMYRKVWFHEIDRYVTYPLPPTFYARKAQVIRAVFQKEVIGGELQAEPWGPGKLLYDTTIEEQDAAFNLAQFQENIRYARHTGITEHYLWGAEWWYWRKEAVQDASFWNEAKKLF